MEVLIMNGTGGSGKGTVAEYLRELFDLKIKEYSSIDYVKSVATCTMGWNGQKDVAGRNLLSAIKQAMIVYNDLPTKKVISEIEWAIEYDIDILIVDIREPDEIEKLVTYCAVQEVPCTTCKVSNTLMEEQAARSGLSLTGDRLYGKYDYDVQIDNNGTKDELKDSVSLAFDCIYGDGDGDGDGDVKPKTCESSEEPEISIYRPGKGYNEHKAQLPFSKLIGTGNVTTATCSECDNTGMFSSELHNALICDYCGQRFYRS